MPGPVVRAARQRCRHHARRDRERDGRHLDVRTPAPRIAALITHSSPTSRMPEPVWADVDDFFTQHLLPADDVLHAVLETNVAEGLPPIAVTPPQGKLLHLLARACGARRILQRAKLTGRVVIRIGRASDMHEAMHGFIEPFDFVFSDANNASRDGY